MPAPPNFSDEFSILSFAVTLIAVVHSPILKCLRRAEPPIAGCEVALLSALVLLRAIAQAKPNVEFCLRVPNSNARDRFELSGSQSGMSGTLIRGNGRRRTGALRNSERAQPRFAPRVLVRGQMQERPVRPLTYYPMIARRAAMDDGIG